MHIQFIALIIAAVATQAPAQNHNCAARAIVIDRLQSAYGESRQSIAMDGSGRMVETWANRATGSWTLTFTSPSGMTCLATSGESYDRVTEALPPQGDKS